MLLRLWFRVLLSSKLKKKKISLFVHLHSNQMKTLKKKNAFFKL